MNKKTVISLVCGVIIIFATVITSINIHHNYDDSSDVIASETIQKDDKETEKPKEEYVVPKLLDNEKLQRKLEDLAYSNPEIMEIVKQADKYPDGMLEFLAKEPNAKVIEFFKEYPDADGRVKGGITDEELEEDHPVLLQYDVRWAFHEYGNGIMASTGCGPTALSMVALELTGNKKATPNAIADYAERNGYYIENSGTSWMLFGSNITEFGIKGKPLYISKTDMINALDEGHKLVLSVGPGDFTKNGHIIVIVDHKDGKFVISDPGSIARSKKLWDFDTLVPQIKGMWEFSPSYY